MTASYEPRNDPAIHGHAYAARHPGQVTRPFPAVPAMPLPALHGQYEPACPFGCPVHPHDNDTSALLYAGPGIAGRNWEARVREGAWDDIPAEFDAAHARVHLPAIKRNRHVRSELAEGLYKIKAVLSAHPDWRTDATVAEGLHAAEAALTAQLAGMQRAAAERQTGRRAA